MKSEERVSVMGVGSLVLLSTHLTGENRGSKTLETCGNANTSSCGEDIPFYITSKCPMYPTHDEEPFAPKQTTKRL